MSQSPHDGFFELGAKYVVDQSATLDQLVNDLGCLISAARDGFDGIANRVGEIPGGWAAIYMLRQAEAVYAATCRAISDESRKRTATS